MKTSEMSDLKLCDELLCDMVWSKKMTWAEIENYSSITKEAMRRLRIYYKNGLGPITLAIAKYFESTPEG